MPEGIGGASVDSGTVFSLDNWRAMGKPVWLDIGAGDNKREGWIGIDLQVTRRALHKHKPIDATYSTNPDIESDVRAIPLPDGCADKAQAIHVIEHLWPWESLNAVKEWVRLLKPGAELAIECPCLDKVLKLFDVPGIPPHMTYWALYGDPRYNDPLMMHRWCYTEDVLARTMGTAGLVNIRAEQVQNHQPFRDMRLVGVKSQEDARIVVPGATE